MKTPILSSSTQWSPPWVVRVAVEPLLLNDLELPIMAVKRTACGSTGTPLFGSLLSHADKNALAKLSAATNIIFITFSLVGFTP